MKKRYLAVLTAVFMAFSPVNSFAADENTTETTEETAAEQGQNDLTEQFSTFITSQYDDELETLTFDDAVEKALRNNSSLNNLKASMDLAESQLEIQYNEAYSSEEGFSGLISFLNSQSSYQNDELSVVAQEESVKHSMKESYINIIELQRDVALSELSLKNDELNLALSKIQLSNGKISQSEYDNLNLAYNTAKEQLETKKETLEMEYVSLNLLMGTDISNRYNFVMEAVYEPFELDIPIESYINGKVALSNSVRQAEKNYETTKQTSKLTPLNSSEIGGYQSAQNSLNSAEMSYEDAKDSVYQSLYQKYNSIVQEEKDYSSGLEELKLLQEEFERTQIKYLSGNASYYELLTAQYNVAEKENTLLTTVYSHMLLSEELTNTELM